MAKSPTLLTKLKAQVKFDTRPEGWKTLEELLLDDPMSKTTARTLLNQAVKDGTVETKKLKSPIKGGRMAIRLNYREKGSK